MDAEEKSFFVTTKTGKNLFAVLHTSGKENAPLVIMVHGFTDDKTGDNRLFVNFAREAAQKGLSVLRFDFFGSGDSEGDFSDTTLDGQMEDLRNVIDYVFASEKFPFSELHLIGYSLGGAVSILAMSQDARIKSFIGWAPAVNLKKTFVRVLGKSVFVSGSSSDVIACTNGSKEFWLKKEFFQSIIAADLIKAGSLIKETDLLIIQGTEDEKVIHEDACEFVLALENEITLKLIDGAGHSFAFYEKQLFAETFKHLKGAVRV